MTTTATRSSGVLALALLALLFAPPLAAQSGQPPVVPNPGDLVAHFNFVGVTSPVGSITGFFTWDFTLQGWVAVEIHYPNGNAAGYGNVFSDPVHISPTSISGAHDSQTTSYDFQLPLVSAFTPTTGSAIALDPPETSPGNLAAFLSVDNGTTASIYPITGGAIVPVVPVWLDLGFALSSAHGTSHLIGLAAR